jgi:alpha-galactosidase
LENIYFSSSSSSSSSSSFFFTFTSSTMVNSNQVLLSLSGAALAVAQSFQSTPLLGWNSYNHVACSPTNDGITKAINALVDRGFVAAGYNYFQVDCGWASRDGQRNATTGALAINTDAFPNGLKPLSDLARSKGMKWTMYSDAGVRMCDTEAPSPVLGTLGHEAVDAEFFKSLNTEYVKCELDLLFGLDSKD